MAPKEYIKNYQSFIFDLDNVIYPERDYLLQVYYLFAQFMEYTEQLNAQEIVNFMKMEYEQAGAARIFEKTAAAFGIADQYKDNFDLLHKNARLPLKLILFEPVMQFMQNLVVDRKQLFLLVSGDPEQQMNKIRQVEWVGLEQYLRVYFCDEMEPKPSSKSLEHLVEQHKLNIEETLLIGLNDIDEQLAGSLGVKYLNVNKLYSN